MNADAVEVHFDSLETTEARYKLKTLRNLSHKGPVKVTCTKGVDIMALKSLVNIALRETYEKSNKHG